MKEIIEELEDQIKESILQGEPPEEKSWGMQEGVLLTRYEAEAILSFIETHMTAETVGG